MKKSNVALRQTSPLKSNHVVAASGKRRRLSLNAVTGNFQLDAIDTPVFKQPSLNSVSNINVTTPVIFSTKENKKPKRSIGRRVSFAATAHVRMYDKETEEWNATSPESQKEQFCQDKQQKLAQGIQQQRKVITESEFQIPDLSSIRRSSDPFDHLHLSPQKSELSLYENDISMESSNTENSQSFEITVAGSPSHSILTVQTVESGAVENQNRESSEPKLIKTPTKVTSARSSADSSPKRSSGASSPKTSSSKRRDSIAGFFDLVAASPEESLNASRISSLRSSPKRRDSIAGFFNTSKSTFTSELVHSSPNLKPNLRRDSVASVCDISMTSSVDMDMGQESIISALPGPIAKAPKRKDSIAGFFENVQSSPDAQSTPLSPIVGTPPTVKVVSAKKDTKPKKTTPKSKSPVRSPSQRTPKGSIRRRDSVAHFFEPIKHSPLRNEIKPEVEEDLVYDEGPSVDLFGDVTGIELEDEESEQEQDMSVLSRRLFRDTESVHSEQMNITSCQGGFESVNVEEDTIGRFFFNSDGLETPKLFGSSPVAGISSQDKAPNYLLQETVASDSDNDLPIRKIDIEDLMDETKCLGGILPGIDTPDLTSPEKDIITLENITREHEESEETKGADFANGLSPRAVQYIASKIATPIRPIIQHVSLNSSKISSEVKRLDGMLKEAMRGTPSRKKAIETPKSLLRHEIVDSDLDSPITGSSRRQPRSITSAHKSRRLSIPTNIQFSSFGDSVFESTEKEEVINKPLSNSHHLDLMDEELSIADCSFTADASEVDDIMTLKEFMSATGFDIPNIHVPDTPESPKDEINYNAPRLSDYVSATTIYLPETQLYEFGCTELKQYIEEGKRHIEEMEAEIESNPPPLFSEFSKGMPHERVAIVSQMKKNKEYAQTATQEAWYSWREKLMEPLSLSLEENFERLKRDFKYATQMKEDLVLEESELNETIDSLNQELAVLRAEVANLQQTQDSEICSTTQQVGAKRLLIEDLSSRITEATMNNEIALADTHNLRLECDSLSKLVKSSQEEVDQYNIPDPLELKELKEEFDLLMVANGWTLKQLNTNHISFIFDSAVIVAFDHLQTGLWTASTRLVPGKRAAWSRSITEDAMHNLLSSLLCNFKDFSSRQFQSVLHTVSHFWTRFNLLWEDLCTCLSFCNFKVSIGDKVSLSIAFMFSSRISKQAFNVIFALEHITCYPFNKFEFRIENLYGDSNHREIEAEILKSGKTYGRFKDISSSIYNLINH